MEILIKITSASTDAERMQAVNVAHLLAGLAPIVTYTDADAQRHLDVAVNGVTTINMSAEQAESLRKAVGSVIADKQAAATLPPPPSDDVDPAAAFGKGGAAPLESPPTTSSGATLPPPPNDAPTSNGAPASDGVERDSAGFPHDKRIHSGEPTKTADGKWRKRRGVSAETVDAVERELLGAMPASGPALDKPPVDLTPPTGGAAVTFADVAQLLTDATVKGKLADPQNYLQTRYSTTIVELMQPEHAGRLQEIADGIKQLLSN